MKPVKEISAFFTIGVIPLTDNAAAMAAWLLPVGIHFPVTLVNLAGAKIETELSKKTFKIDHRPEERMYSR